MSSAPPVALKLIAEALSVTYDLGETPEVGSYLLGEAHLGALGFSACGAPEQVFVVEHELGMPELGLYLADDVLAALARARGARSVSELLVDVPLAPLMYATEGVSHVLWLEQRRRYKDSISQVELELQAELDKFVIVLLGSEGRIGLTSGATRALLHQLFVRPEIAPSLDSTQQQRYRAASRAAETFLRAQLTREVLRVQSHALVPTLRRHCRQSLAQRMKP